MVVEKAAVLPPVVDNRAFLEIPKFSVLMKSMAFKNMYLYLVFLFFIFYFLFVFVCTAKEQTEFDTKKTVMYMLGILIPLVVFAYMVFSKLEGKKYFLLLVFITLFVSITLMKSIIPSFDKLVNDLLLFFTGFYRIPMSSPESSFLISITLKLLIITMFFVFLAIVYNIFLNESFRQKGKLGVVLYALFFIPCLISDYVKYLFNEIKSTPLVVFSLIFMEIIFILLYVYLPKLISKVVLTNSIKIVDKPSSLYNKHHVGNKKDFYNVTKTHMEIVNEFNKPDKNTTLLKNYSLSMWITLNAPTMSSSSESMIFRLGDDNGTTTDPDNPRIGAPYIGCKGSKMKIVFSNNVFMNSKNNNSTKIDKTKLKAVTVEIDDIPFQTWNYFVFNYHDSQVDLFVNGKLTETKSLAKSIPIYSNTQVCTIGSDLKLVHGSICEARVQSEILNETQIVQTYNLLKFKNPPVNNII
jgi:hypothetical protein